MTGDGRRHGVNPRAESHFNDGAAAFWPSTVDWLRRRRPRLGPSNPPVTTDDLQTDAWIRYPVPAPVCGTRRSVIEAAGVGHAAACSRL